MTRPDTIDAINGASFTPLELTDESWPGPRKIGGLSPTFPTHIEQVGPLNSIRLDFGEISDTDTWVCVETTVRGEYGRVDAGNGYEQVFSYEGPPEQRARSMLETAVSLSNVISRFKDCEEHPAEWISDEEEKAIKNTDATDASIDLDGEQVTFRRCDAFGLTSLSAVLADRTVTLWGRFDPTQISLRTVPQMDRYVTPQRG